MKILNSRPLFIALVGIIFALGIVRWRSDRPRDYYQFWVVGQAVKSMELTNIYGDEDRHRIGEHFLNKAKSQKASLSHMSVATYRRVLTPAGTPFLYSVFSLFSTGRYDLDYEIFRIGSFGIYIASIAVLCTLFHIPLLLAVCLMLLLTQFFGPFRLDVMEGNINQLQVGIITFILWLSSRPEKKWANPLSGVVLGMLVMLKPNLAPLLAFWILGSIILRPAKSTLLLAASCSAGMAFGLVVPFFVLGRTCGWWKWISAVPRMVLIKDYFDRSFLGLFFGAKSTPLFLLWMGVLIVIPFFLFIANYRSFQKNPIQLYNKSNSEVQRFKTDNIMIGLGVCVYLLSSTLVHFHYVMLVIPFLLYVSWPHKKACAKLTLKEIMGILVGIAAFLLIDKRAQYIGNGNDPILSDWKYAFIGVAILYAWGLYIYLWKSREFKTAANNN
ncbi:MAG: hypothetical protein ACYDH0_07940 [Candidatus Aminicenantales bacterium]